MTRLHKTAPNAVKMSWFALGNATTTFKEVFSGKIGITDVKKSYDTKTVQWDNALKAQSLNPELAQKINAGLGDGSISETDVLTMLQGTVTVLQELGKDSSGVSEVLIYDGEKSLIKGYRDKNGVIGFNVGQNGLDLNNGTDVWEVAAHEVAHAQGMNELWAGINGKAAGKAWNFANNRNGYTTGLAYNQSAWLNNQYGTNGSSSIIFQGSEAARQANNPETFFETGLDLISLGLGIYSLQENIKNEKYGAAALDSLGILLDSVALATPLLPGGIGVIRAGDKATDVAKNLDVADTAKDLIASAKKRKVVIGEEQGRVNKFAKENGMETITDWMAQTGKEWSPEVNQEWVDTMKKVGADVHDIGPDFDRRIKNKSNPLEGAPPSKIYGAERKSFKEYNNLIQEFVRNGKYWSAK